jgi:peptidoglycan hydrolase-like protein with peptidoglycan-binding domain
VRRTTWSLAGAVVLAAVIATGAVLVTGGAQQQAVAAPQLSASTANVERRTLAAVVSQAGILTYRARSDGSPYSAINQARGTYTKLPAVGQVISQGRVLYRVNNRPVLLLHGSTPAYRTLSAGATGPDVAELNADLVALGYATRAQVAPTPTSFGSATTAAVKKIQAAVKLPQTGTLTLGQVVFEPTTVRVTALLAQIGGRAEPGQTVMQATSTTREVQVALDASQQTEAAVGNRVTITLPNNLTVPGVVSSVGTVAKGSPTTPTITVGITPSHPAAAGAWDQAPVQVGITTARVRDALVVPVTALLARSGGGYAVELAGTGAHATNRLVPVSLGLFDDAQGLVQITGPGLAADQKVVVPST